MTIKDLRLKHKLSQSQLAEQLNISASTVYRWEQGSTAPSITQYRGLCKIFGYSVMDDVTFGGADNDK